MLAHKDVRKHELCLSAQDTDNTNVKEVLEQQLHHLLTD